MNRPDHVYKWQRYWRRSSWRHRIGLPSWLCWEWPWQHYRRTWRHERERVNHGYSWHDWICFDTFLSLVIADACRDFRAKSHGYPGGDVTLEQWNDTLLQIETAMRFWGEKKFDLSHDEEIIAYEAAKKAMHLVADNLGHLWD